MANENSKAHAIPQIIPLAKIHDLPGIPLSKPPDKTYGGLVTSIQAGGVKEPVILRLREDGEYQLVTGYRRRRASELAKKADIPALVYQMTLPEAIAYHSGVQRQANLPVPGKLVETAGKEAEVPPVGDKPKEATTAKEAPATTEPAKDARGQTTDPKVPDKAPAPAVGDKPKEATGTKETPATTEPAKDAKGQTTGPRVTDKAPAATVGDKPKEATTAKEAPAATEPAKDAKGQATDPKAPDKASAPVAGDKPMEAVTAKAPAAAVVGPAAQGPTGTAISKVLESRLAPPASEAAKKDFPIPKEGESFFVCLHPAYLVKSEYNIISVDTQSEDFRELKTSIALNGVKDPVLARIGKSGNLEILSGQRRHMIATELNYPVPTIIQKIDDADAKILASDGNLHRPHISSYDLSRSLRLKMEGMKQKSGRKKKGAPKVEELNSDEKLAKEMGISVSKLNRMLRLSEAVKGVCDRVDDGSLHLSIASAVSFLTPEHQDAVLHLVDLGFKLSTDRIEYMKKVEKWGKLDDTAMRKILDGENVDHLDPNYVPPAPPPIPPSPDVGAKAAQPAEAPASVGAVPTFLGNAPTPNAVGPTTAPAVSVSPVAAPAVKPGEINSGKQERPEYTKITLAGDRLRKYFPDVSMTPHEIEDSIYDALEERRQRQIKAKQRDSIFKGKPR